MIVVHVIPDYKKGGAEALVQELKNRKSKIEKRAIYFTATDHKPNCECKEIFLNVNPRNIFAIFKIRQEIKKILYETNDLIIHAHLTWPLFFVAIATVRLKVKLIYTEHSTFNKRRNLPLLKFLDLIAYSRYSSIVCISRACNDSLLKWLGSAYQKKIKTIDNGAKLKKFVIRQNIPKSKKLNLVSVGALKGLKGFETTIKSIQKIRNLIDSYTIVGEGLDLAKLQKLVHSLGLDDIVLFTGWSDFPEKYFYSSDIILVPSHWEGFGLVAVEGMSSGMPIIASNVPGLDYVAGKSHMSSILIDNFLDPDNWSSAIMLMHERLQTASSEMSIESRKHSEKFNIDKMINAYESLYLDLIKK